MRHALLLGLVLVVARPCFAGPQVTVVVGPKSPPLERLAASELAGLLRQHLEVECSVVESVPAKADYLILVGSPATHPAVEAWAGDRWPKLSAQGHTLRSVQRKGRTALVIGGGSPVATLWAAYELGHHLGIRYLPEGDQPPARKPELKLEGIDRVLEPVFATRAWRTLGTTPTSLVSWGLEDQKRLLRQLAKLKFNHLVLDIDAEQPFLDRRGRPGAPALPRLWAGPSLRVDGDTGGRHAFRGLAVFDNPDLRGKDTAEARITAAQDLARGILGEARQLGMKTSLAVPAGLEALALEQYRDLGELEIQARGAAKGDGASREQRIERSQVTSELPSSEGRFLVRLGDRPQSIVPSKVLASKLPRGVRATLLLPLEGPTLLPQLATNHVHAILGKLSANDWDGYSVRVSRPQEQAPCLHYLSRASFDRRTTPENAYDDLITALCGEGTVERVGKGFGLIEKASDGLEKQDPSLGSGVGKGVLRYRSQKDLPGWWKEVRTHYAGAMDEMYRAQQRAPGRMRPMLVYHAKRLEFGIGYLDSVTALRESGRVQGDPEKVVGLLEKATEAMYNGLNALGEVARDPGDRAVIAILNAQGYRLLKAALEASEK